jgi:hypothetical protein
MVAQKNPVQVWLERGAEGEPNDWAEQKPDDGDYVQYVRADIIPTWLPLFSAPRLTDGSPDTAQWPWNGEAVLVMWKYWANDPLMVRFISGRWRSDIVLSEQDWDSGPTHYMRPPAPPEGV